MRDRKVLIALSALSVYELNSFSKYIQSPYFNSNRNITLFFELLEKSIKNGNPEDLKADVLWSTLFPDQAFNNQKFLKLNSDLVKLLEDFLSQKEFDNAESIRAYFKLEGARKRNMEKLYPGILSEVERLDKREMNQSSEFYLTKYQLEKSVFSLKTENEKKNEKFEISAKLNIKDISDNLDFFYVAEKLKQYCTLLSWKKMYNVDIEMGNMQNVLQLANSSPYADIPPISIYYKMYLTYMNEEDTQNYYVLRSLTKSYMHIFPIEEQKEIYSTIINYCINKTNKNQADFFRETFELYKEGLANKTIFSENEIIPTMFRNIVIASLRLEEFAWAENFIRDYAQYVDGKFRENAVEFSLARLGFYKKNFGKVLDHLSKVTFEDVWYTLGTKTLQIASYYELDEYEALESLLQAFKMYIRREKSLTEERKETYLNLIKFSGTLMKLNPKDQDKVIKLKDEILNTKGVASKPWLIEKVDELIKK